ncbi:MAG: D-alanyl-D-alanine carboxypeptidase, partial [Lachnospiraceae bacterium]|nr:D-alanyl-D-alanine carboxypeptidase [Lachnospiraceae bacterium]
SAVVGDAMTGEVFAGDREEIAVPIASTTKLMSYAVIMDAITNGEIGANDTVVISDNAANLSQGQDRVIPMKAGQESNVQELMKAMLVASSNESVLALAEYVAGSEEAFVRRMTEKAAAIGLSDATVFYNCNGLPVFVDSVTTAKRQNHMSAIDMFKLCAHILTVYPQITEITTIREDSLPSLHMDIKTTNALLYNEPDVIGLKTGTTNMAGSCLACAMRVNDASGQEHDVVAVVHGAEDNTVRFSSGDVLLRYGRQCVQGGVSGIATEGPDDSIPTDAEGLIRRILARY